MTRKEFLRLFALAFISLFGVNNFLTYVMREHPAPARPDTRKPSQPAHGFGSRTFGS